MEDYKFCFSCKEFHYSNKSCRLEYKIIEDLNSGIMGATFYATSHYDAALKYAEYDNLYGDNTLINTSKVITVKFNDEIKQFKITAQSSVNYTADELNIQGTVGFFQYLKLIRESSSRYIGLPSFN